MGRVSPYKPQIGRNPVDAYEAGRIAAMDGKSPGTNPHKALKLHAAWRRGWHDAALNQDLFKVQKPDIFHHQV